MLDDSIAKLASLQSTNEQGVISWKLGVLKWRHEPHTVPVNAYLRRELLQRENDTVSLTLPGTLIATIIYNIYRKSFQVPRFEFGWSLKPRFVYEQFHYERIGNHASTLSRAYQVQKILRRCNWPGPTC